MGERVHVFEVGPRDGLQNEKNPVSLGVKKKFISGLSRAGVRDMEVGAFVRPDRVPQMADTESIYRALGTGDLKGISSRTWALVPNERGLERALASGVKNIAVFTAASDGFNRANIGMTVRESLRQMKRLVSVARKEKLRVRGYVSTVFGCPFDGKISPAKALRVIGTLGEMDVEQVSIGDTIGVATPKGVQEVMGPAVKLLGAGRVAGHFHDTRGTALANALRSLELGVRTLDASAGGLGGCPFAPGATGNLATEDLVYLLHGMGFRTGIDLDALCEVSLWMAKRMNRPLSSRYLNAYRAGRSRKR